MLTSNQSKGDSSPCQGAGGGTVAQSNRKIENAIREYLNTIPNVTNFRDEHVQFGGAGITVVDIG